MSEELESRVSKLEAFAADVRGYTQVLTEMMRRHDERLDTFDAALSNLTVKVEALADAQIHTEEKLSRLESVVEQMATDTNARLTHLVELVERHVHDGHA